MSKILSKNIFDINFFLLINLVEKILYKSPILKGKQNL